MYHLRLAQYWQDHLKPKDSTAPVFISTFAGGGGSSLGYSMAGFKELLAVEYDKHAVECLKNNFDNLDIYHGDIKDLSVQSILSRTKLQVGQLDVLDGSPPCQGFSTSGKRQLDDPRNELYHEFVRLLNGLKPKFFVMENVSGMKIGIMRLLFAQILKDLKAVGYKVEARLIDASLLGVPQKRKRFVFIGIRNDLNLSPEYPTPQSNQITPYEAFKQVTQTPIDRVMPDWLLRAAQMMHPGDYSGRHTVRVFIETKGKASGAANTKLLDWNKVACTLVKSEIASTGIIHPSRRRYLTIAEMKRLQSFPDEFKLHGTREQQVARLGNSVPPLMMREIALVIKTQLSRLDT